MPKIKGLYAITPDWTDTEKLLHATRSLLEGGASAIQYRNKSDDVALQHAQASELIQLCHSFKVPLIINDNLRLADLTDADGLHLGAEDASIREARFILGPDKIIGISCYDRLDRAKEAEQQGAGYVAFGSFFASPTKPNAVNAPLFLLEEAKRVLHIPVVAIGGITLDNANLLVKAGADAVAVISALYESNDLHASAANFTSLFHRPDQIQ
ncbi:thiamine phosphate synthase [Sulfurirhabdus autotrophica]|nr:thiamine phosphate synthase [Sulfurirhabdus autotrophica]